MSDSEEEHLVYLEFDSLIDTEVFKRDPCVFKLIGVDSDTPVLQVGNQVFTGQYHDIPGTALFFEEDPKPQVVDPVFSDIPDKNLQFVCKTRKALHMSRVFVKRKCEAEPSLDKVPGAELVPERQSTTGETADEVIMAAEPTTSEAMKEDHVPKEKGVDVESTLDTSLTSDTCQPTEKKDSLLIL